MLACGGETGGIQVTVDGALNPRDDFDSLRIEVFHASHPTPIAFEHFEANELHALPLRINFLAGPATPVGTELEVAATASLREAPVASARGRAQVSGGAGGAVTLSLGLSPLTDGGASLEPPLEPEDGGSPLDGGGFQSGLPLGAGCSTAAECASGLCEQAVCCDRSCQGACESCASGTCSLRSLGSAGSTSCSPYVCRGDSASCPGSCSTDAHCISGRVCVSGACIPPQSNGTACSNATECASGNCLNNVCSDPHFGETTIGPLWQIAGSNVIRVSRFALSSHAQVNAIVVYMDGNGSAASGSQVVRGVIYSDSSGPAALLGETVELSVAQGAAAAWVPLTFESPVSLAAGHYWLGLHTGNTTMVIRYPYHSESNALAYRSDNYSDGAPNPFGAVTPDAKRMSIYATYE